MAFARVVQFLLELSKGEFFGSVSIQFRRGVIVTVRREETFDLQHEADKLPVQDVEAVRLMQTGGRLRVSST